MFNNLFCISFHLSSVLLNPLTFNQLVYLPNCIEMVYKGSGIYTPLVCIYFNRFACGDLHFEFINELEKILVCLIILSTVSILLGLVFLFAILVFNMGVISWILKVLPFYCQHLFCLALLQLHTKLTWGSVFF